MPGGAWRRTSASYSLTTPSWITLTYIHSVQAGNKPTPFLQLWRRQVSTTGLCTAVVTFKKRYTLHQAAQLHRWIVKQSLASQSILQSDAETSLMQLVNTVAADLNLLQVTRESPPSSHQSQVKVERFIGTSSTNFLQSHFHGPLNTAHSS